jgi:hypothetical protein
LANFRFNGLSLPWYNFIHRNKKKPSAGLKMGKTEKAGENPANP